MDWISVDDRLPKVCKKKQYLVCFDDQRVVILGRPWKNTLGWEYVTHWMGMPKKHRCVKATKDIPHIGETVIVFWSTGLQEIVTRTSNDDVVAGVWGCKKTIRTITHWMQLPKPPEQI